MSGKAPGKKCTALQAARLKKQLAKKAETKGAESKPEPKA